MRLLDRLLHRKPLEARPGPQGREYEALKMSRRAADERADFAENTIRKAAHKNHPFLDDPYR